MATIVNVPPASLRWIAFKYALYTTGALILYFLLMRMANLAQVTEFRFVNYVIIAIGMYMALKEVQVRDHHHRLDYLPAMGTGFFYSGLVALMFGIFMVLDCAVDFNFIPQISRSIPHWGKLTSVMVGFEVASEILLLSVVINLMVLMLFKRNRVRNAQPAHRH